MRRLSKKKALSLVKELDAFPKIPESYVETTATGGTVSLIAFTAMALLAFFEFFVYRETWMKYDYEVDKDFSSKMRINIDITVAMKCQHVGADILDLAETMITSNGLRYEPVIFELSPQQRLWHRTLLLVQNSLREEHALQEVLYKSVLKGSPTALPPREHSPTEPLRACRIHGHVYVNKVAGNFHVTVGKPIHHPRGHAHIAAFVSHDTYNFSHRIDHLSFGEEIPGIINPLDGTEKITDNNNHMFQYFITVVPTKLHTSKVSADTHQFSVTERERVINHAAGSHGVSGIFVKYDTSSLMVTVSEQHMPLWQFLVRLCGIIGGIFSTTGMLHGLVGFCFDVIGCRFKLGLYRPREAPYPGSQMNNQAPLLADDTASE
ncbi:endoplasmic reticulum-Golgi intermediate compartment protein 2-like [Hypomesus transpacificus]|uniref:endoplasmic reticulum-Golgi intermediate compartment protein 2-like n=1 Tax=Hypomesus transpacificus TaxID=137520 RepID=UPI001F075016|nr:endoplasmic reticulum-Golgi intermediate compartment protein 2-like [Hypomesus transpacificus]XP_046878586.1 endoplasmic reticulum-Golgi intermediate compartment protein 2-like [Hypomesus transpacificus]XP_046878587.1 endoplasmic reticulum-Golgi intermediate compartment protein 2-like [Hypomesus transpacificus]